MQRVLDRCRRPPVTPCAPDAHHVSRIKQLGQLQKGLSRVLLGSLKCWVLLSFVHVDLRLCQQISNGMCLTFHVTRCASCQRAACTPNSPSNKFKPSDISISCLLGLQDMFVHSSLQWGGLVRCFCVAHQLISWRSVRRLCTWFRASMQFFLCVITYIFIIPFASSYWRPVCLEESLSPRVEATMLFFVSFQHC